ncbi:hypothetical protein AX16_007126 [Volvariella volvacea WC 439]|nr:hypothetical protein AX16_007126 [Volvariella volvacea WC 439]
MRFSAAALALFGAAVSVSASVLSARQLPDCSMPCIANAPTDPCATSDNACLCRNENFIEQTTVCIMQTCQGDDLQNALAAAQEMCRLVGVTLTSTPTLPSETGSSSESASETPESSETSASETADNAQETDNSAATLKTSAFAGLAAVGLAALAL